jgi:hypothetical protein
VTSALQLLSTSASLTAGERRFVALWNDIPACHATKYLRVPGRCNC